MNSLNHPQKENISKLLRECKLRNAELKARYLTKKPPIIVPSPKRYHPKDVSSANKILCNLKAKTASKDSLQRTKRSITRLAKQTKEHRK